MASEAQLSEKAKQKANEGILYDVQSDVSMETDGNNNSIFKPAKNGGKLYEHVSIWSWSEKAVEVTGNCPLLKHESNDDPSQWCKVSSLSSEGFLYSVPVGANEHFLKKDGIVEKTELFTKIRELIDAGTYQSIRRDVQKRPDKKTSEEKLTLLPIYTYRRQRASASTCSRWPTSQRYRVRSPRCGP